MRPLLGLLMLVSGIAAAQDDFGACLADTAREQVGVTVHYAPAYVRLDYPDGDVPADRGVCTDVVIRAYRRFGADLQRLVHEDMTRSWSSYPKHWGLSRPDSNIDHRRVPNLATYFKRHGQALPVSTVASDYLPGDLVTWRLTSGVPHIGVVSGRKAASGTPLMIHNIGAGVAEEDMLFRFVITGHYRYRPEGLARTPICAARS